jgi:hypothetical protein
MAAIISHAYKYLLNLLFRHSRDVQIVRKSKLFNKNYYLEYNQDVRVAGVDPIRHFIKYGGFEGRSPSINFDTKWYMTSNQDVARSGQNPLLHYIRFGREEGRLPSPIQPYSTAPPVTREQSWSTVARKPCSQITKLKSL